MAIKKNAKKTTKKVKKTSKSAPKKTIAANPAKNLQISLVELIKNTSAVLPDDVQKGILSKPIMILLKRNLSHYAKTQEQFYFT